MDQSDAHVDGKSDLLLRITQKNKDSCVMTITAVKAASYLITIIFYVEGKSFKM